jgi:putative salt-induced outer membrane protein YdiY
MRSLFALAVLSLFALCSTMFADQIVLKNGDRLSGTIVKSDGKTLLIKTEFAGDVTVQWPAIEQISSSQPLHVSLTNGQTVVGAVSTTDGNLAVATPSRGTVNEPKAEVSNLRSEAEWTSYEKSLHPPLTQGWQGGANVGFALTRGNSQTKNLALAFTADRKTMNDEIAMYTNSVYAANDAPGAVPATTANAIQGGIRYDHDLTKRLFAFVGADFQTDDLQALNLRSIFGGGLGFHVIKNDKTTLDFLGGLNYTRENYVTFNRNFAALTLGEEFTHKVGMSTLITQKFYMFPDLSDTGEFRGTFNFGTVTKINKWLGWQNAFGDIYVTNPPAGKKQNDIIFTTGLNVSFTH